MTRILGKETENQLFDSIKSTVDWLLQIQREDGLWNQELKEDGEIFWEQTTLASIISCYPLILVGSPLHRCEYPKCRVESNRSL